MCRQLFQHVLRRRHHLALAILHRLRQIHLVEQHIAQLLRRIDVESMPRLLENLLAHPLHLRRQRSRHQVQHSRVDAHARPSPSSAASAPAADRSSSYTLRVSSASTSSRSSLRQRRGSTCADLRQRRLARLPQRRLVNRAATSASRCVACVGLIRYEYSIRSSFAPAS